MRWYLYSLLTSLSFVGMVLCVRGLTNRGFAPKQILFFLIGFALLGFIGATAPSIQAVLKSDRFLGFLAAASFAGVFATIGHLADFEAIKRAPNPGFSISIRNCNILPVTILSVFLFGSSLGVLKVLAALLILGGIIALVLDRRASSVQEQTTLHFWDSWVTLSMIASISFAFMVFGMKQATRLGFSPPEIMVINYIINFIVFAILCRKDLKGYLRDRSGLRFFLPVVFAASLFAFVGNLLSVKGLELAPNPGYHEAIKNTNVLFVTLLAVPMFSANFDRQKVLGVVSVVAGIVLLVI